LNSEPPLVTKNAEASSILFYFIFGWSSLVGVPKICKVLAQSATLTVLAVGNSIAWIGLPVFGESSCPSSGTRGRALPSFGRRQTGAALIRLAPAFNSA
jgi:predicted membrane channel-forming protein YqfA (hemolysin III family)